MALFTTDRERRLWLWTLAVIVAIYATLGPARTLADVLRAHNLLRLSFALGVLALVGALAWRWAKRGPDWGEVGVALGVALAYLAMFLRMESPEERTHLIEYGIVAALLHQALLERARHGRPVPAPAALAVALTALLGLLDESIQSLLPNRVFDIRDIGFNAFAGFMVIAARLALAPQRRPGWRLWFLWLMACAWGWGTAVGVTGLGEIKLLSSPPRIVAAYLGMAAAGLLVGGLQWLMLRTKLAHSGRWVLASLGGVAMVGVVVFGVGVWGIGAVGADVGWVGGMGVFGLVAGVLQWRILRPQVSRAGWWVVASTVGWLVGLPAGEMVGWNGLGAVYGLFTGTLLVWLLRQNVRHNVRHTAPSPPTPYDTVAQRDP